MAGKAGESHLQLWVGTHHAGPAKVLHSNLEHETLNDFIHRGKSQKLTKPECNDQRPIPFMMKIMSVARALSLQIHPTRAQARLLHKRDPLNYPDTNHKRELAYALTEFRLICGFRPLAEIVGNLQSEHIS